MYQPLTKYGSLQATTFEYVEKGRFPMAVTTPRLQEVTAQQPQVAYRFVKVEDYFSNYRSWNTLGRVIAYEFDSSRTLALTFQIDV